MSAPGWRFNPVSDTFWNDTKVRSWSEDGRLLGLYLLTNPHRSGEGFYHLPVMVALDDLSWHRERFNAALAELVSTDFAAYDEEARLVLIVKALKHHVPIRGNPSIKGALNQLDKAKGSPRLFGRFLAAADRYEPEFARAIREHYVLPDGPFEGG